MGRSVKPPEPEGEKEIQEFIDKYTEKKTYGQGGVYMLPALRIGNQYFDVGRMREGDLVTGNAEDEEYVAFMRRCLAIALIKVVDGEKKP